MKRLKATVADEGDQLRPWDKAIIVDTFSRWRDISLVAGGAVSALLAVSYDFVTLRSGRYETVLLTAATFSAIAMVLGIVASVASRQLAIRGFSVAILVVGIAVLVDVIRRIDLSP